MKELLSTGSVPPDVEAFGTLVKGEIFFSVHKLTDEQYNELFESLVIIAERMRALGSEVPVDGVNKEFAILAKLSRGNIPHKWNN